MYNNKNRYSRIRTDSYFFSAGTNWNGWTNHCCTAHKKGFWWNNGKTPILKLIYSAFNDLFSAFAGKEKKFNKPVIVLINPSANLEKLGFLTEEDLSKLDEKNKVAVYFPHSYGFTGEVFVVPKSQVRSLPVNSASLMKFILSGGVSGLDD
ncbi:MAG: DUF502 domain-containing protein [Chloroflexia bacterium]|nr:DUF502 domain-containing protein [Chloroflexia bacterium]